jgi:hypothetical protein
MFAFAPVFVCAIFALLLMLYLVLRDPPGRL